MAKRSKGKNIWYSFSSVIENLVKQYQDNIEFVDVKGFSSRLGRRLDDLYNNSHGRQIVTNRVADIYGLDKKDFDDYVLSHLNHVIEQNFRF